MEQEPNATSAELNPPALELPVALNGLLQDAGDVDCFRIRAEAGQKYDVEVFASRPGSPVDTLMEIHTLHGAIVAVGDDGISHDSQISVTFPASTEHICADF